MLWVVWLPCSCLCSLPGQAELGPGSGRTRHSAGLCCYPSYCSHTLPTTLPPVPTPPTLTLQRPLHLPPAVGKTTNPQSVFPVEPLSVDRTVSGAGGTRGPPPGSVPHGDTCPPARALRQGHKGRKQDEDASLRRMFTSDINIHTILRLLGFSKIWEGRLCGWRCRDFTPWPLWDQGQPQSSLWSLLGLCPDRGGPSGRGQPSGGGSRCRRSMGTQTRPCGVHPLPPAPCPPAAKRTRIGGGGVESGGNRPTQ